MDHLPVLIGEYLDLDMARPRNRLLEIDRRVAERAGRLAARQIERREKLRVIGAETHSLAAAAVRRLDQNRIPDRAGSLQGRSRLRRKRVAAGYAGDSAPGHRSPRLDLVTHDPDRSLRRTDPEESRLLDRRGELRVLGEKPISGMDELRSRTPARIEQAIDGEITLGDGGSADPVRFVR
jgi:hypothetical protein